MVGAEADPPTQEVDVLFRWTDKDCDSVSVVGTWSGWVSEGDGEEEREEWQKEEEEQGGKEGDSCDSWGQEGAQMTVSPVEGCGMGDQGNPIAMGVAMEDSGGGGQGGSFNIILKLPVGHHQVR